MIKLTDLEGNPIWVMKTWVQMIRAPRPHEYMTTTVRSVICLSGINWGVREESHEIAELLGKAE